MFQRLYGLLDPQLAQIIEYKAGTDLIEYLAEAAPGNVATTLVWRVRKFTYDVDDHLINVTFADGTDEFKHAADDMSNLTYS